MAETTDGQFPQAKGYKGIWYANQKTASPYVYKYSGGLGTYCAKQLPFHMDKDFAEPEVVT